MPDQQTPCPEFPELNIGIKKVLDTKHVVLQGGSQDLREEILCRVKEAAGAGVKLFEVKDELTSLFYYYECVSEIFPIKSPVGMPIKEMSYAQIGDVLLDWTGDNDESNVDALVILYNIAEFDDIKDVYRILNDYITTKHQVESWGYPYGYRLLVSSAVDLTDYYNHAIAYYNTGDGLTDKEIASLQLAIIDLDCRDNNVVQ